MFALRIRINKKKFWQIYLNQLSGKEEHNLLWNDFQSFSCEVIALINHFWRLKSAVNQENLVFLFADNNKKAASLENKYKEKKNTRRYYLVKYTWRKINLTLRHIQLIRKSLLNVRKKHKRLLRKNTSHRCSRLSRNIEKSIARNWDFYEEMNSLYVYKFGQ